MPSYVGVDLEEMKGALGEKVYPPMQAASLTYTSLRNARGL